MNITEMGLWLERLIFGDGEMIMERDDDYGDEIYDHTAYDTESYDNLPMSREPERFDLIPPFVLMKIAKTLGDGARDHGEQEWRKIPSDVHIGRAIRHLVRWQDGESHDELINALCRIMFAWSIENEIELANEVLEALSYGDETDFIPPEMGEPEESYSSNGKD